jgi:hypothetical protein
MSRRRKILIGAGIAFGLAILLPVLHHYQLRWAVEKYIAELKAQGEPMELAQVIPPPVPPEQNSASNFLKAVSLLNTNYGVLDSNSPFVMRMIIPGKAIVGWRQPEVHSDYGRGEKSWEEVEAALAEDGEGIKLLRQITDHPMLDFDLAYSSGAEKMQIPYLVSEKKAARRLSAAAIDDLHRGDSTSAVKNVRAMLALANGMSHDRVIISELVRMAIAQMAVPVTWELLQSTNLTGEQLVELQNDWTGLDFIRGEENALAMERVISKITFTQWRNSGSTLQNYLNSWLAYAAPGKAKSVGARVKLGTQMFRWRYWWSYSDELQFMKGCQVFLGAVRLSETNYSLLAALHDQENQVRGLDIDSNSVGSLYFTDLNKWNLRSLLSGSVYSLNRVLDLVMKAETSKQMAATAIALKRYQLKHGNYPKGLNSLVPEFVSAVPLDPVDGKPLRYKLNEDGTFVLYSVGENGVDDGGNPALSKDSTSSSLYWQNPDALDWVWPQSATEAEIQNYYAHPPK